MFFCCFLGPKISIFPIFALFSCFLEVLNTFSGCKFPIFALFSSFLDDFCLVFGSKKSRNALFLPIFVFFGHFLLGFWAQKSGNALFLPIFLFFELFACFLILCLVFDFRDVKATKNKTNISLI